jgi:hypothetical protein
MPRTILLIPLCLALIGSAQPVNSKNRILDSSLYTIIQKDSLNPVYLSGEEISGIEKILKKALNENKFSPKTDFRKYRFQLVPYLNPKGEKEIFLNCFCYFDDWQYEWRTKIFSRYMIEDGGDCFFDLKINLTFNTYYAFGKNGYG